MKRSAPLTSNGSSPPTEAGSAPARLAVRGLTKRFGDLAANESVDLTATREDLLLAAGLALEAVVGFARR